MKNEGGDHPHSAQCCLEHTLRACLAWGEQLRLGGNQCHGPGTGTGSAAQGLLPLVGPLSPVLGPGRGWGRTAERGGACSEAQEQMRKVR